MTQGRGRHSREFSHYEPIPKDVQAQLVAIHDAERAEGH
jgi:translation elongation factor EF-G